MALYRFSVGGNPNDPQLDSIELASLADAKAEAAAVHTELMRGAKSRWDDLEVTVTDQDVLTLFIMRLETVDSPAVRRRQI